MTFFPPNPKNKPLEAIAWMEKNLYLGFGKNDAEKIRNMGVSPLFVCPMLVGYMSSTGINGQWLLAGAFLVLAILAIFYSCRVLSYLDLFPQVTLEEVKRSLAAHSEQEELKEEDQHQARVAELGALSGRSEARARARQDRPAVSEALSREEVYERD